MLKIPVKEYKTPQETSHTHYKGTTMEPAVIVLIVFGSTGAIFWKFFDSRHKERMSMIEKGVSAADLRGAFTGFRPNALTNLKFGLLALFVGLGVMAANYLDEVLRYGEAVYPSMILIFGGFSLVLFYFIAAAKEKKQDN